MLTLLLAFGVGVLVVEAPLCPSATLLGIPCPGCGLTRATLALLSGDIARALHFHPLVFLLAPLYFGLLGAAGLAYVRGPASPSAKPPWLPTRSLPFGQTNWLNGRFTTFLAWCVLALVLGVWVARFFGAFGGPVPVKSLTNKPVLGRVSARTSRSSIFL